MSRTRKAGRKGAIVRGWVSKRVVAFAKNYAHGSAVKTHTHDRDQLIYASSGVMTVRTARGAWVVPTNRAVWVPSGVRHSIHMFGAVEMRTLYFEPKLAASLAGHCCVLNVSPLLRELVLHVVALKSIDPKEPGHIRLVDVILDQLAAVREAPLHLPMPKDRRAVRVAQALLANPADSRLLEDFCRLAHAGKRTLELLFKTETGMSFRDWRCQLRIQSALTLLAAGRSVTAVALDVGYDSTSAFVAMFKRILGYTPGKYFRREE